jgi:hypothetical protein
MGTITHVKTASSNVSCDHIMQSIYTSARNLDYSKAKNFRGGSNNCVAFKSRNFAGHTGTVLKDGIKSDTNDGYNESAANCSALLQVAGDFFLGTMQEDSLYDQSLLLEIGAVEYPAMEMSSTWFITETATEDGGWTRDLSTYVQNTWYDLANVPSLKWECRSQVNAPTFETSRAEGYLTVNGTIRSKVTNQTICTFSFRLSTKAYSKG